MKKGKTAGEREGESAISDFPKRTHDGSVENLMMRKEDEERNRKSNLVVCSIFSQKTTTQV
jgi:hypothetical protein